MYLARTRRKKGGTKMSVSEDGFVGRSEVEVRIAATIDDYATAFRIAYDVYHPKGFTAFSPYGMRATVYQLHPSALILLAYHKGNPIATLSLYEENGGKLPSASGWPGELADFQRRGIKAFELGTLMSLPDAQEAGGSRVCLEMFRVAWRYARCLRNADALCAFVQAHHEAFYTKIFRFRRFGEPRNYEWNGLQIAGVAPLIMDLNGAEEEFRQRYNRYEESARNLYRFFVIDRQKEIADMLIADLRKRDQLDWNQLQALAAPLLQSETDESDTADEEETVENVLTMEQPVYANAL
ncbi:MAG: hypothetical protein C0404_01825 [Verrucomicrobia bacterium]|nr:hypothetical protein [Verrucomicrobiota bacterium]